MLSSLPLYSHSSGLETAAYEPAIDTIPLFTYHIHSETNYKCPCGVTRSQGIYCHGESLLMRQHTEHVSFFWLPLIYFPGWLSSMSPTEKLPNFTVGNYFKPYDVQF